MQPDSTPTDTAMGGVRHRVVGSEAARARLKRLNEYFHGRYASDDGGVDGSDWHAQKSDFCEPGRGRGALERWRGIAPIRP